MVVDFDFWRKMKLVFEQRLKLASTHSNSKDLISIMLTLFNYSNTLEYETTANELVILPLMTNYKENQGELMTVSPVSINYIIFLEIEPSIEVESGHWNLFEKHVEGISEHPIIELLFAKLSNSKPGN